VKKITSERKKIGIILSGATSQEASCQLLESSEKGKISEGILLIVETGDKKLLARVSQIIPYNAFYTEGDPWSEARRKGQSIPKEISRQYEICKLDLLIEIPRDEIKSPPQPGDSVITINLSIHEKDIFGVSKGDPNHIWMGSLSGYNGAPIPLNLEKLPMHLAVFGVTGSGKSYTTGVLIERLSQIPYKKGISVSYPLIIIDAHGDYLDYVNYVSQGEKIGNIGWIRRYVFPNAFISTKMRRSSGLVKPIGINLDNISRRELAEIIILYYKGTTQGADLQVNGLEALFNHLIDAVGYTSIQSLFTTYYDEMIQELKNLSNEVIYHTTKTTIQRALDRFRLIETEYRLLSTTSELKEAKRTSNLVEEVKFIDDITREGGIAIFDFSADGAPGVDLATKQLIMTYLATMLLEQFTNYKIQEQERYLAFIIEEAQNFCPDSSYPVGASLAHLKLTAIATQGRKFGLTLCLISQRPHFVDKIVLSMCNTFLIHRVSPDDVNFVKSVSGGLPSSLSSRLTTLNTGELILTGQMNVVPFPLSIWIPENDRLIKPIVGKTNVIENIAKWRNIS
jgi:DNA helicase HerA-like ATPase